MSLLSAHFEQIAISCQGIDSLPFPQPKIFTNALLSSHDITSLIRDTEAHERALFSVPPPPPPATAQPQPTDSDQQAKRNPSARRQTVFNVASGEVTTSGPGSGSNHMKGGSGGGVGGGPRRHTAVAAVLGGDLHEKIRRSNGGGGDTADVELLLRSAEKLCGVYAPPGALERIPAQRRRHASARSTLAYYEAKVAEQGEALASMKNRSRWGEHDEDEDGEFEGQEEEEEEQEGGGDEDQDMQTEEDLRAEEEQVRELDRKKRELQARLRTMDKDLGGLLHM